MKLLWLCAGSAISAAVVLAPGCSSDPPAVAPTVEAGSDAPVDICDTYTKIGDRCAVASAKVCFRTCKTDGCRCVASASGAVWACSSDFSCQPDAAPTYDASTDPPAGDEDASTDASNDSGGDADGGSSDAALDGAHDAASDG